MLAIAVMLAAATTADAQDPVLACQARHAAASAAYIACLEDSLRRLAGATRAAAPDPAPAAATVRELGGEQVAEDRRRHATIDEASAPVDIVSASYDATQLGTFTLANGQVWRETSLTARALRLAPGKTYHGTIAHGALGGYRLYVDGIKYIYTVRRQR